MYKPSPTVDEIAFQVQKEYTPQSVARCNVLLKEIQVLRNHLKARDKYILSLENELHTKTTPT